MLVGSCKLPRTLPNVFGVDLRLHLDNIDRQTLSPFWHFEPGGCNALALSVRKDKSAVGACSALQTAWGEAGERAVATIGLYYIDPNHHWHEELEIVVAALSDTGEKFEANVNYYLFHLVLKTSGASSCAGCGDPMSITWSEAAFTNWDQTEFHLKGPDKGSSTVMVNGASTPIRMRTWPSIKALYR